ncbi:MAG: hypothetical protein ICV68_00645 [Pyrinomonadaceae bacterium]|nr:hypothetical protein [Pyrinomonadaceae bacterium]
MRAGDFVEYALSFQTESVVTDSPDIFPVTLMITDHRIHKIYNVGPTRRRQAFVVKREGHALYCFARPFVWVDEELFGTNEVHQSG